MSLSKEEPILLDIKEMSMKIKAMVAGLVMFAAHAAMAADVKFDVVVSGAKSDAGKVLVRISATEAQFDSKQPGVRDVVAQLKDGKATVRFEGLPAGKYAITVVHDANGNGKLDSNMIGMPTEAFGFSNNPVIRFGPPAFKDTLLEVRQDSKIEIRLVMLSFGR